jgi:threonine aldolase
MSVGEVDAEASPEEAESSPEVEAEASLEEAEASREELLAVRRGCTRFVHWHGWRTAADYLAEIPQDAAIDEYGQGGVVAELEAEVAGILGKPAAAFLPSGTMAQQIALRIHADRRGRRTVLFHPECHLDTHEGHGYERLHGLQGRAVGESSRLVTLDDLRSVAEPVAALLLELPQRDLGGQLPAWEDLVAQVEWARRRGAAVHMDGARLWGCECFYGRSLQEISEPFDTVYVSFYKQLGALAGSALAGPVDLVDEVREWRRRHGGTLNGLWPLAASGLNGLRTRFPRIPDYRDRALGIAAALRDLPGVDVLPDPPHTTMMHLLLHRDARALRASVIRLGKEERIWTFSYLMPTGVPGVQRFELEVGDATLQFSPQEFRDLVERLLRD